MAGSKQGWVEAPYCACPAGRVEVGRKIIDIDAVAGARIAIVPGLSEGVFVLPGTHNKWASVKKGRVAGFRTYMTSLSLVGG